MSEIVKSVDLNTEILGTDKKTKGKTGKNSEWI